MVNKKFSDFTSVNELQEGDLIPGERFGIENIKISKEDFTRQLRSELIEDTFSDALVIKMYMAQNVEGVPTGLPENLLYLDGSTKYVNDINSILGKFVNSIKDIPYYRTLFNIPADNSSIKLPDYRNLHPVGVGSLNPVNTIQTSKSVNFIQSIGTTTTTTTALNVKLTGGGSFRQTWDGTNNGGYNYNFVADGNTNAIVYGSTQPSTSSVFTKFQFDSTPKVDNQYHQINFNFAKIGTSTSTATSTSTSVTTPVYNTGLIDSVNRVPAFSTFYCLDISLSRLAVGGDTTTININDVIGLQEELNSKQDKDGLITDLKYDANTTLLDKLDEKAPISALNNYLKKDGSVALDNTYVPEDYYHIATKGYVDDNFLMVGGEYTANAGAIGIKFNDTFNNISTIINGNNIQVKKANTRSELIDTNLSFYNSDFTDPLNPVEKMKFNINTFNGKFFYYPTFTTSVNWDLGLRQINDNIATGDLVDNSIILKKDLPLLTSSKSSIVQIPILTTTINAGAIATLNLGTPTLIKGDGVVADYISIASNIIKIKKVNKSLVFGGKFFGDYASPNGTREIDFRISRPAVVSVAGTNANDVIFNYPDVKTITSTAIDISYSFPASYILDNTDPFFVDGLVLRLNNSSTINITSLTSRTGWSGVAFLRIEFKD